MSTAKLYIPRDAGALGMGSADVEQALIVALKKRGIDAEFVHTGSRGLYWLEPMIEVATPQGRVAYGPVAASEVEGLLDAGLLDGKPHKLCLGKPEELPFLQRQTAPHLRALRHRRPQSARRLPRARRLGRAWKRRCRLGPAATVERGDQVRAARPRWRRLPDRHQMEDGARYAGRRRNTSSATPTKAIPAPTPTA